MKGSPRRREPELQAYKSGTQANPKPIASVLRTAPTAFARLRCTTRKVFARHGGEAERANLTRSAWQAGASHDRFQARAVQ